MFKLLLPYEVPASVLDKYKDTFEFVGAVDGKEEISMDEAKELIRDCDAIFSMRVFPIPEELLACGEKLRVVTNHGVGYDHIDVAACSRRGILAINTPQAVCEPTAEFTMALLLGITKGITMFDRNLRRDRVCNIGVFFDRDILLYGKTVGIVGFGRIGQAVARRLQGFGVKIVYYDPIRQPAEREAELGVEYRSFDELIAQADVITCHLPLTEQTRHLISFPEFAKMKPEAYLINAARGPIVEEAALMDALKTKQIRGAATDVFEFEPNISEEMAGIENLIITPHVGASVLEAKLNMVDEALTGAYEALSGTRPHNLINGEIWDTRKGK